LANYGDIDTDEFHVALAHVLMDVQAQGQFLDDPGAFQHRFKLTDRQLEALHAAGLDELRTYSASLAQKRLGLLTNMSPNMARVLMRHGVFSSVSERFIEAYPPRQTPEYANRVVRDVFWFHQLLQRMVMMGELQIPHLMDVVQYDRVYMQLMTNPEAAASFRRARDRGPSSGAPVEPLLCCPVMAAHAVTESFSCDVLSVIRTGGEDRDDAPPAPTRTTLMLFMKTGAPLIQIVRINELTRRLLGLCDGTRTMNEIFGLLCADKLGNPILTKRKACLGMLDRMASLGIVSLNQTASGQQ